MKKIYFMLALVLSICLIFASVSAFDSPWDHFSGPKSNPAPAEGSPADVPEEITDPAAQTVPDTGEGFQTPAEEPEPVRETIAQGLKKQETPEQLPAITESPIDFPDFPGFDSQSMKEGTFTIDSIRVAGMDDESSRKVLDMLESPNISFYQQTGETPRSGFRLSMNNNDILTYSLQKTDPYYISSNFLGSETYMITDQDLFEEKLVTSFYALLEKMSDQSSSMPPLEEILGYISAIRNKELGIVPGASSVSVQMNADYSVLMPWLFSFMGRFVSAEPDQDIDYLYTDLDLSSMEYNWPARENMPDPGPAASSTTAMFFGDDIIAFLDLLPQLFEANPELKDMINQSLGKYMQNSVPAEDGDYVSALLEELENSPKDGLKDLVINFKMDQAETGAPVRIALEFAQQQEESVSNGMKLIITMGNGESGTVIDIAGNLFAGEETMPLFRSVVFINTAEAGNMTLNIRSDSPTGSAFEYAQSTNVYETGFGSRIADTGINYFTGSGRGMITVLNTTGENELGKEDSSTQISFTHESDGQPVISIAATATSTEGELLPALTPDDAVHASDLTESDYDNISQTILMQMMMLMMNFM